MKRTITVLQDDIDNGVKEDPNACAIARAGCRELADLLDGYEEAGIDVCHRGISLNYLRSIKDTSNRNRNRNRNRYHGLIEVQEVVSLCFSELPAEAYKFIEDFDAGVQVEPFKFEIDIEIPKEPAE